LQLVVFVTTASLAPLELAPVLVDEPVAGQELATVRLYVLDGAGCAGLRHDNLPTGSPFVRDVRPETVTLFSTVDTELDHQLVARRGLLLPMPPMGRCRDKVDAAGHASLEKLAMEMFPTPAPPLILGLPMLGEEASRLMQTVELRSILVVEPTSSAGHYQID